MNYEQEKRLVSAAQAIGSCGFTVNEFAETNRRLASTGFSLKQINKNLIRSKKAMTIREDVIQILRDLGINKFEVIPSMGDHLTVRVPLDQVGRATHAIDAELPIALEELITVAGLLESHKPIETDWGALLDISKPIFTTTGLACRLLAEDLKRTTQDGYSYPYVVAVMGEDGQERICLATGYGNTRNGLFDITNDQEVADNTPAIDWEEYNK